MNVVGHLRYAWYVLRHKWFVLVECWRLGVLWRGITHDLSKLRPSEWFPYVAFFYPDGKAQKRRDSTGYYKPTDTGDSKFDYAWLLHQKRNRHHWQFWLLPEDDGGTKVLPMPDTDRKEMLADWRGAGRAQKTKGVMVWYEKNKHKMTLHRDTREWIERHLAEVRD